MPDKSTKVLDSERGTDVNRIHGVAGMHEHFKYMDD